MGRLSTNVDGSIQKLVKICQFQCLVNYHSKYEKIMLTSLSRSQKSVSCVSSIAESGRQGLFSYCRYLNLDFTDFSRMS